MPHQSLEGQLQDLSAQVVETGVQPVRRWVCPCRGCRRFRDEGVRKKFGVQIENVAPLGDATRGDADKSRGSGTTSFSELDAVAADATLLNVWELLLNVSGWRIWLVFLESIGNCFSSSRKPSECCSVDQSKVAVGCHCEIPPQIAGVWLLVFAVL